MTHEPVMMSEMLAALAPASGEVHVDGTFGGGGYTRAILGKADCRVIGIDRDPAAPARAAALGLPAERFSLLTGCFGDLESLLAEAGVPAIDGLVLDLGVSSFQIDDAERGFSFQQDGPLDMRMGGEGESAADLVNTAEESTLVRLLFEYGEESEARAIARAIVKRRAERPFERTLDLASVIAGAKRRRKPGRDPATNSFQALRLAVNDELGELERVLAAAERVLAPGGRLVVVSFHSLEDRLVKRFVDARGGRNSQPSRHLPPVEIAPPLFRWLRRGVVKPSASEVDRNPRARSARLRTAIRVNAAGERDDEGSSWPERAVA